MQTLMRELIDIEFCRCLPALPFYNTKLLSPLDLYYQESQSTIAANIDLSKAAINFFLRYDLKYLTIDINTAQRNKYIQEISICINRLMRILIPIKSKLSIKEPLYRFIFCNNLFFYVDMTTVF